MRSTDPARHPWLRRARGLFYRGSRIECPFCRGRFRRLRPGGKSSPANRRLRIVGAGRRPNRKCPRCRSTDRERLVLLHLRRGTDLLDARAAGMRRILHVAPERELGRLLRRQPHVDYVSADLDPSRAMVGLDVAKIPYPDDHFDAILCNHVLEHVPDDRLAMSELHRVLRPGGLAILQVPVSLTLDAIYEDPEIVTPESRERVFGQRDHVRVYSPSGYRRRLEEAGFEFEELDWTRYSGFGRGANRYALNPEERIQLARKPGGPATTSAWPPPGRRASPHRRAPGGSRR